MKASLGAAALLWLPALAGAQAGITVQQKTSFNVARITSADLNQTVSILGADRARTVTTGKVKVLIISRDAGGTEITRLDQDQVIKLDDKKKKYEIKNLAELRADLLKQQQDAARSAPEAQEDKDMRYYVVVDEARRTGERKPINGFDTEQVLIRITVMGENTRTKQTAPHMYLVTDTWVDRSQREAARISAAYQEARTRALGMDPAMAANPYSKWLREVDAEMVKVEGYPILTRISFELPVDSTAAAPPAEEKPSPEANPLSRGLGGLLGRKAKPEEPAPKGSGRPVLFTSTVEVLSISTTPPPSGDFEIPAGYTKK